MKPENTVPLSIVPQTLKEAALFVGKYHRHSPSRPIGIQYAVGIRDDRSGEVVGVATMKRPSALSFDDGRTLDVARVAVRSGIPNGCSMLYGACARIAEQFGYEKIITYTLESESGVSLRATGWIETNESQSSPGWDKGRKSTRRHPSIVETTLFGERSQLPQGKKVRWEKSLNPKRSRHEKKLS